MTKTENIIKGLEALDEQLEFYGDYDTFENCHERIEAAIDHLKAMQWVPIADIPEAWKDGRILDGINPLGVRSYDLMWSRECSRLYDGKLGKEANLNCSVTHVMFPIAPPTLGKTEE